MSVFQLFFTYIGQLVNPYAWNIGRASWSSTGNAGTFSVTGQDTAPLDVFFKPDGTKMYVLGDVGRDVNEYTLSTPWDVTTATFVAVVAQGTPLEADPTGLFFKSDGLSLYITGSGNDYVSQYTLTTAWDVTTATFLQRYSVTAQETLPQGVFFSTDGDKMYVMGLAGDDVNEYTLSTPWNVLTASYTRVFSVATQETNPKTVFFKPDGTKMYISGNTGRIHEYTLTTPWDLSTAGYTKSSVLLTEYSLSITAESIWFKPDGTELYILSDIGDFVSTFILHTPWDVSTITIKRPTNIASLSRQFTDVQDIFFHPDGTKMYALGQTPDAVAYYELGTPWSVSTIRYVDEFVVEGKDTTPTGLFFKPDGLEMYVIGTTSDSIHQYTLGTAWLVSTASFIRSLSVADKDTSPNGIFFTPDGLGMYMVGSSSDSVHQYSLATAWNISTASFVQSRSVSAQDTNPSDITFKPDGLKMYVLGSQSDRVNEYNLTTAWDISTATFVQNLTLTTQEAAPNGVFFKPDGTRMYIAGANSDTVYEYVIS